MQRLSFGSKGVVRETGRECLNEVNCQRHAKREFWESECEGACIHRARWRLPLLISHHIFSDWAIRSRLQHSWKVTQPLSLVCDVANEKSFLQTYFLLKSTYNLAFGDGVSVEVVI